MQIQSAASFEQRTTQIARQHHRLMLSLMSRQGVATGEFRIARFAAVENGRPSVFEPEVRLERAIV